MIFSGYSTLRDSVPDYAKGEVVAKNVRDDLEHELPKKSYNFLSRRTPTERMLSTLIIQPTKVFFLGKF